MTGLVISFIIGAVGTHIYEDYKWRKSEEEYAKTMIKARQELMKYNHFIKQASGK